MDKKTVIGLVIVGVILFGYTFYNSKQNQKRQELQRAQYEQQEKDRREQFVRDSIDRAENPEKYALQEEAIRTEAERLKAEEERREEERLQQELNAEAHRLNFYGDALIEAENGTESIYTLENDVMKLYISTRGAKVENVWLKEYQRYHKKNEEGDPLMMYKEGSSRFDMGFYLRRNAASGEVSVNTGDYIFSTDQPSVIILSEEGESQSLAMRLKVDNETDAYLEYVYTIYPGEYAVDFKVNFVGMRDMTTNMSAFDFNWGAVSLQNEKSFKQENMATTMAYRYPGANKIEQIAASEGPSKLRKETTKVEWLSFKQQYFSSIFKAEEGFSWAEFGYQTYLPEQGVIKNFSATLSVPYSPNQGEYKFNFYFGPNKYSTLKKYDSKYEKIIPLGGKLIGWINAGFVIPVFNWLGKHIASFGIIILLLTLMIKLIILPLTYKSYMSSAKMRALKPELDEINERYPKQEDAMKKQQATMAVYKQYGVSPMGGCLPMLIQMPILIAMFRFFPASIELRGQSFLWAEDLSAYDSILDFGFKIPLYGDHISLFTLFMAAAMFIYSRITYKQSAATGGQQMAGMKFMTVYLMPIMMLCWFNSYASGLTYYYMLSQLITIALMTGFKYFVNEEKLRAKMQAKAKVKAATAAPKKKSKFQQRYEEALRQQQQAQRQQSGGNASGRGNTSKPQSSKNQPKKKR